MNRADDMMTLLDAWFLSERGEDPSKAIENQEKRGQQSVVRNMRLPKKTNDHKVPRELFWRGTSNDMSYEERKKITDLNNFEYTREQYEKMGVKIINEYDDLFCNVELPEGWEIKATDHTMWNELIDNKGRKRATFFYKAAYYDRDAFINFETRYQIEATHNCDPCEDYDIWRKADYIGTVKDGDKIIYATKCVPVPEPFSYDEDTKIKNILYAELEDFMNKNYPEYKDFHAYWD
jgi:hypothetical protein